jgi:hypothetical protein
VRELEKLFVTYSVLDKCLHGLGNRSSTMDFTELKVGFRVRVYGDNCSSTIDYTELKVYVCTYVGIHTHIYTHAHTVYVCMYVCMYVCIYIQACLVDLGCMAPASTERVVTKGQRMLTLDAMSIIFKVNT